MNAFNGMKLPGRSIVELLEKKFTDTFPLQEIPRTIASLIRDDREIHAVVEEHVARPFYPDTPLEDVVQRIADPRGRLSDHEKDLALIEHVITPRMRFERRILRAVLPGLTPTERALLQGGLALADRFDSIGYPCPNSRTLARAHPRLANFMADDMDGIRAALPLEADSFHHYFGCLRSALLCRVPSEYEALWHEVDETWNRIPPEEPLIPVMNSNAPGFRLLCRKEDGAITTVLDSDRVTRREGPGLNIP